MLCQLIRSLCFPFVDFGWDASCVESSASSSTLKFYSDSSQCRQKALSDFEAWEADERFDTLDECCLANHPYQLSECCDSEGLGGCNLSGTIKYLPNWVSQSCYAKDAALMLEWESSVSHNSMSDCCETQFFYDTVTCCDESAGGC